MIVAGRGEGVLLLTEAGVRECERIVTIHNVHQL